MPTDTRPRTRRAPAEMDPLTPAERAVWDAYTDELTAAKLRLRAALAALPERSGRGGRR